MWGLLLTYARKLPLGVWVAAALALGCLTFYRMYEKEVQRRVVVELQLAGEKQVDSVTRARLALTEVDRDSLKQLLTAAHELHGTLVAGAAVHVPPRDTTIIHRTLSTRVQDTLVRVDTTTRVAHFRDSTFAGTIDGTVTAPPTGPLGIAYTLHRPAFAPELGFVKVGDRYAAIVSWQGEQVHLSAPYMSSLVETPRLLAFVDGTLLGPDTRWVRGGISVATWEGVRLEGGIQQPLVKNGTVGYFVGLRREWALVH